MGIFTFLGIDNQIPIMIYTSIITNKKGKVKEKKTFFNLRDCINIKIFNSRIIKINRTIILNRQK